MANRLDVSGTNGNFYADEESFIIICAAIGVWAYFGVLERITMLKLKAHLQKKIYNRQLIQ